MARRENDTYYSTAPILGWLLDNVSKPIEGTILEPCSGSHVLTKGLRARGFRVITNDIDGNSDYKFDILDPYSWLSLPPADWVLTNVPFNCLDAFLPLAFEHSRKGLAVFCRKSATEPTKGRVKFLQSHRRHLSDIIFCPRVSFTSDGRTDDASADWLVFRKEPVNGCIPFWIDRWE